MRNLAWTRKAVVDSSLLIVLFKAGLEWILPKLFDEIIVPDAVGEEIESGIIDDPARISLPTAAWAKHVEDMGTEPLVGLGLGESSVISMALRLVGAKVVLDDAAARGRAKALGLSVVGTGGLLVLARRAGEIDSLEDAINSVIGSGLWIDPATVELLIRKARHD